MNKLYYERADYSVGGRGAPSVRQKVLASITFGDGRKEAFNHAVESRADALLVHVDALFNDGAGQSQIIALAGQYRLPTMMATATFPARGGLISYGADTRDLNRQAGVYVARVLRGEKPADLPVVQPTNFALRVNLKTAKALGLSIPESFLLLADEVIE
jgi:ABC-type uncharacterized transport system substrate-binding protein